MKEHQKYGFEKQFLTDAQYVACSGGQCPNCHGDEITGHSIVIEGGSASQEVTCDVCGAGWDDIYVLAGYDNLELDTNQEQD